MSLIADVAREPLGMFIADARLTLAVLALVAAVAALLALAPAASHVGGGLLLIGCLAILVAVVVLEAARRRA